MCEIVLIVIAAFVLSVFVDPDDEMIERVGCAVCAIFLALLVVLVTIFT